jgi:hypothetical protein
MATGTLWWTLQELLGVSRHILGLCRRNRAEIGFQKCNLLLSRLGYCRQDRIALDQLRVDLEFAVRKPLPQTAMEQKIGSVDLGQCLSPSRV